MVKMWLKGLWQILTLEAGVHWVLPFTPVTEEVSLVRLSLYAGIVVFVIAGGIKNRWDDWAMRRALARGERKAPSAPPDRAQSAAPKEPVNSGR
jgi:hypothetical protein